MNEIEYKAKLLRDKKARIADTKEGIKTLTVAINETLLLLHPLQTEKRRLQAILFNYATRSNEERNKINNDKENQRKKRLNYNTLKTANNHYTPWTEQEECYLLDHYGRQSNLQMAEHLGRTLTAVKNKLHKLDYQGGEE